MLIKHEISSPLIVLYILTFDEDFGKVCACYHQIVVAKQVHLVIIQALTFNQKITVILLLLLGVVVVLQETHPYWTMIILTTVLSI